MRKHRIIFMALLMVLLCATAVCFADDGGTESNVIIGPTVIESVENEIIADDNVQPNLEPQYNISLDITTSFEAGSGIAECGVAVETDPGTADTVNMRITLERLTTSGYVVVKTWRDEVRTVNSYGVATISRQFALTERGTYRFRTSGTVYKNGTAVATFTDVTSGTDPY